MKVKLIKPFILVKKELKKGTIIEVTNGYGEQLISMGVAINEKDTIKKSSKLEKKSVILQNNKQEKKPVTKIEENGNS